MNHPVAPSRFTTFISIFWQFTRLGWQAFGGPPAHIALFQRQLVNRQAWLSEQDFGHYLLISQLLPGPASSQLGFLIGVHRGGLAGGIAAFIGFTWPTALLMLTLAYYNLTALPAHWQPIILTSLLVFALALVTQATWHMAQKFCTTLLLWALALVSTGWLVWQNSLAGLLVWLVMLTLLAQLRPWLASRRAQTASAQTLNPSPAATAPETTQHIPHRPSRQQAWWLLGGTLGLALLLPLLAWLFNSDASPNLWAISSAVYHAGLFVMGGGQVVLPFLQIQWVNNGWISAEDFLAGYAYAQFMPGPMFAFASYLGALTHGPIGALVATLMIFLPGLLLAWISLSLGQNLFKQAWWQRAQPLVLVALVGLLAAMIINPLALHTLTSPAAIAVALLNLALLQFKRLPSLLLLPLNLGLFSLLLS
ncbi:chromate efflux transporter [Thiomicrospira aerophila]|uniref:chromate efflux transporter n=1 Tax=Thiomicrospira aerophila TaxID=92245 RepID=UPI00022C3113|nr:chromate efflux transporter [Thiomicrospira aerophila]